MLVLYFFGFWQVALGCLSKFKSPEDELLQYIAYKKLIPNEAKRQIAEARKKKKRERRNLYETAKTLYTYSEEMNTIESNFASCFGPEKVGENGISIYEGDTFEEKKRQTTYWIASTNLDYFEATIRYLKFCETAGIQHERIQTDNLVHTQLLLLLNAQLIKVTEETLPDFISLLKAYAEYLFKYEQKAIKLESEHAELLAPWREENVPVISEFCNSLIISVLSFARIFDPELELFKKAKINLDTVLIRFDWFYAKICEMTKITSAGLIELFNKISVQQTEWSQINGQIKVDFYKMLEEIKKMMDSQFADQSPEDVTEQKELTKSDFPAAEVSNSQGESVPTLESIKGQEKFEVPEVNTAVVRVTESRPSREELLLKHKENKAQREEARTLRSKLKHQALVEKLLEVKEDDDKDVTLYYSSTNEEASRIYRQNQSAQACKMSFSKSDRFQHSIYPEITASGETINFLCSLLVSGTPTYEGFLAAHKDLGGVFVQKKNGNKLFFFKEPISYHKTLHAPHLSSSFDHVLYRRFYRNCALHPYFFKLIK